MPPLIPLPDDDDLDDDARLAKALRRREALAKRLANAGASQVCIR